ncbi:GtrA family protein [Actinoplanes aureus]|uniref:GtrA family protein n=1 Tax=Actinoplanes aureus TaxID=2792083 RepID=A0A931G3K7_9ACTN|nr:GtrA family protein [Actinoplanes aureus]MBG0567106.1 GtrA family protein [Actinoplanes aureus]
MRLLWFMVVGAVSTVVQTIVYVAVREAVPAIWASWLALLVVTPLNTELHRRVTFAVKTTALGRLHWEAGLTSVAVFVANLAAAPLFTGLAGPNPPAVIEALILALTGSLIGGARYLVLRGWVFAAHRHQPAQPGFRADRRCRVAVGSRRRRARLSPTGRRSAAPDQRPASTR